MKIIFVTPLPPPMGGISNWSKLVLDYIDKNCDDIETRCINISPKKRSTEGRTIIDRVFGGFISMISSAKKLKKELKYFKPDVVHINTSGSLALLRDIKLLKILKRKKVKSILHIRFGRVPEVINQNSFESKLLNKAFQLTNTIITIDQNTYKAVNEKCSNKTVCIANPFKNDNMPSPRMLDENNCSYNVTYLGWVVKTKGIEELLEAWNTVYINYPSWSLKIIGPYDKNYYDELRKKYSFDGIEFLGEQKHDSAMNIVNNSDIFILPSYTEGFPNVILEAMYLGKAIIATNVGAIPEMLENNCGIIINSKSTKEIEDELKKLFESRKKIIEIAYNAKEKSLVYSIDNIINEYIKVWN